MLETLQTIDKVETLDDLGLTYDQAREILKGQLRKQIILGGPKMSGLEVLCDVLGYKDLGKMHREECEKIEAINPYIAYKALKNKLKDDDLHIARKELASRFKQEEFDINSLKRIWLWARGHLKTTIVSYVHTIQLILIDPNIRILIMHHKLEKAKDILRVIKNHFIVNEEFRWCFPEYCPIPNKMGDVIWDTSERITVPNRSKYELQEPTIDVSGVDSLKTGGHYDYMKKDDMATEDSVTSETMLKQSVDADKMTLYLFDNYQEGPEDYIGTRYHFADLYASKLKEIPSQFQSIIPGLKPDGEPSYPEKFTKEGFEQIRLKEGSYQYSCQIMLNPIDPANQVFKKEWIQWYEKLPEKISSYLFVDPATAKKKKSDYTAMIVLGVDDKMNWYIVDIIRDKLNVNERVESAWSLAEKHGVQKILWEAVGFAETDINMLSEKRKNSTIKFPIETVSTQNIAKVDRIRSLQPYYERKQVFWPKEITRFNKFHNRTINYIDDILLEYETFPFSEHDDLMDAHSQALKTSLKPPQEAKKQEIYPEGSWGWYLRQMRSNSRTKSKKLICTRIS